MAAKNYASFLGALSAMGGAMDPDPDGFSRQIGQIGFQLAQAEVMRQAQAKAADKAKKKKKAGMIGKMGGSVVGGVGGFLADGPAGAVAGAGMGGELGGGIGQGDMSNVNMASMDWNSILGAKGAPSAMDNINLGQALKLKKNPMDTSQQLGLGYNYGGMF